jgi:hypothetical protein
MKHLPVFIACLNLFSELSDHSVVDYLSGEGIEKSAVFSNCAALSDFCSIFAV